MHTRVSSLRFHTIGNSTVKTASNIITDEPNEVENKNHLEIANEEDCAETAMLRNSNGKHHNHQSSIITNNENSSSNYKSNGTDSKDSYSSNELNAVRLPLWKTVDSAIRKSSTTSRDDLEFGLRNNNSKELEMNPFYSLSDPTTVNIP